MQTDRTRRRCPDCRKYTDHVVRIGRLKGRGRDAHQDVVTACNVCGRESQSTRHPNLLADFFSIPARRKEDDDVDFDE
jgi:hypothetical protein